MLVQYFRGPRNLYSLEAHGQGIYFATDTHEIIHNDIAYSGVLPSDIEELVKSVDEINKELDILTGGEGSSIQASIDSAINDFAEKISDDGTINTFKELVDYASEHKEDSAQLILDVDNIKNNLIVYMLQNMFLLLIKLIKFSCSSFAVPFKVFTSILFLVILATSPSFK